MTNFPSDAVRLMTIYQQEPSVFRYSPAKHKNSNFPSKFLDDEEPYQLDLSYNFSEDSTYIQAGVSKKDRTKRAPFTLRTFRNVSFSKKLFKYSQSPHFFFALDPLKLPVGVDCFFLRELNNQKKATELVVLPEKIVIKLYSPPDGTQKKTDPFLCEKEIVFRKETILNIIFCDVKELGISAGIPAGIMPGGVLPKVLILFEEPPILKNRKKEIWDDHADNEFKFDEKEAKDEAAINEKAGDTHAAKMKKAKKYTAAKWERMPLISEFSVANCISFDLGNEDLKILISAAEKFYPELVTRIINPLSFARIFRPMPYTRDQFPIFSRRYQLPYIVKYCFEKHFSTFNLGKEVLSKEALEKMIQVYDHYHDWDIFCFYLDEIVQTISDEANKSIDYNNESSSFNFANFLEILKQKTDEYVIVKKYPKSLDRPDPNIHQMYSMFITPSRLVLTGPTPELSNRVLRKFKEFQDRFIRVHVCDEDFDRIKHNMEFSNDLIHQHFLAIFKHGITLHGRTFKFLAFSSSQLRQGSSWFFAETDNKDVTCNSIRKWMGDFSKEKGVAKRAARFPFLFFFLFPRFKN